MSRVDKGGCQLLKSNPADCLLIASDNLKINHGQYLLRNPYLHGRSSRIRRRFLKNNDDVFPYHLFYDGRRSRLRQSLFLQEKTF